MNKEVNSIALEELHSNPSKTDNPLVQMRMDLVGHVELEATVNVGSVNLTIQQLFTLKPGETLKLNEDVDTPVALMVNNRVVALGTLVAVDDCFGIQIQKIEV